MNKKWFGALLVLSAVLLAAPERCPPRPPPPDCDTFEGHGRHTLHACDSVEIAGSTFELTGAEGEFSLAGRALRRGIDRRNEPWIYVHEISRTHVDVTFEKVDSKSELYPLLVGSAGTIFDLGEDDPHRWWPTNRWSVAELDAKQRYWLVVNRWGASGVHLDLQKRFGTMEWQPGRPPNEWQLIRRDLLLPADGDEVILQPVGLKLKLNPGTFHWQEPGRFAAVKFSVVTKIPVLFVHGHSQGVDATWIDTSEAEWTSFEAVLAANPRLPIDPVYLDLPLHGWGSNTGHSIIEDATTIQQRIQEALSSHAVRDQVAIVANSQGSLSSRYYLKNLMGARRDVSELVTIAAPNHGLGTLAACGNAWQPDRARRELCGGLVATNASASDACGHCSSMPGAFRTNTLLPGEEKTEEEKFLVDLNGHELGTSCDPAKPCGEAGCEGEAPGSRSATEEPDERVLYVNLFAAGAADSLAGGESPGDCVCRIMAWNHAPNAENIPIPGIPTSGKGAHANTPHHWRTICVALQTVLDQVPPIREGEDFDEDRVCFGLERPQG